MAFNLEEHIKNHAFFFFLYRATNKNDLHFNFSYEDLQFIGRDKEQEMMALNEELKKPRTYREPNGSRYGVRVYANRTIDLGKHTKAEALHFEDPNGGDTMPHWHKILDQDGRYGFKYSLLKKHISQISEEFGFTPNFDEMVEHNPTGVKNLSKAVNTITWAWKRMDNKELRKSLETRGVSNAIKILGDYALKTNTLTYYVKSLEGLKTRLNRLKMDIEYQGHDLRNTYPIPLRTDDLKVIKLIVEKRFNQKDMKPYLKSPILRDFIRYSAKTTEPFIINALKEQTSLLVGVKVNKGAVENFLKLVAKTPVQKKSRLTKADNNILSARSKLGVNLKLAAQSTSNEKELRQLMQEVGYQGFGFKKTKGSITGCFYLENEKKQEFKFIDINVNWLEIKRTLMENHRKQENGGRVEKKEPHRHDLNMVDEATLPLLVFPKTPQTVEIEYRSEEIKAEKEHQKSRSRLRRLDDGIRNGIQELENKIAEARATVRQKAKDIIKQIRELQERFARATKEIANLENEIGITNKGIIEFGNIEDEIGTSEDELIGRELENADIRAKIREVESPSFIKFRITSGRERITDLRAEIGKLESRRELKSILDNAFEHNHQERETNKQNLTEQIISPKR